MGEARNRKIADERRSAMTGTCQNCMYHSAIAGDCRRHAPRAFMIPDQKPSGFRPIGLFPPVRPDFWFGEHAVDLHIAADGADRAARQSM
jgi:hypothetical protein